MRRRHAAAMLWLICAASAGCGRVPARYALEHTARGLILAPPQRNGSGGSQQLGLTLARNAPCGAMRGASHGPSGLGLSWSLVDRRLTIQLDTGLARWGDNLPVPLIDDLNALRATLADAVHAGCVPAARAQALLAQAAESKPLSPRSVQVFLYGGYAVAGYIDIRDPVRLQLQWALDRAHPDRYDLGYVSETWALAAPLPDGRGALRMVSRLMHDAPVPEPWPSPPQPLNSPGPRFYRLFFLLRRSPADHDVGLLSATTWPALLQATVRLRANPAACGALRGEATCEFFPPSTGLEARLRIWIGGRETSAALTDTVADALEAAGDPPERILSTLRIERRYAGGWAPVVAANRADLPRLLLAGDDRIAW